MVLAAISRIVITVITNDAEQKEAGECVERKKSVDDQRYLWTDSIVERATTNKKHVR